VDYSDDDALFAVYVTAAREYCEKYTRRAFFTQQWELSLDHFPLPKFKTSLAPEERYDWPFFGSAWDYFAIRLPKPTCISVDSVTYLDLTATLQTLSPSSYYVDYVSEPARLVPSENMFWPYTQQYLPGSIRIGYTSGSYVQSMSETFTVPASAPYVYLPKHSPVTGITSVLNSSGASVSYTFAGGVLTFSSAFAGLTYTVNYSIGKCPQPIVLAILLLVSHWYEHREDVSELNLKNIPLGVTALLNMYKFDCLDYRS
jgi:hypothetical protein